MFDEESRTFEVAHSNSATKYKRMEELTIEDLPSYSVILKFKEGVPEADRSRLLNKLERELDDESIAITDIPLLYLIIHDIEKGLEFLSIFICGLDGILFLFSLLIVSTSVISENSREIGILRSLGVTVKQLVMMYIHDGLSVVLSSYLLGVCTGIVAAIVMTLQTELFTETPFQFTFPTVIVVVLILICVCVSIIATIIPLLKHLSSTISQSTKKMD